LAPTHPDNKPNWQGVTGLSKREAFTKVVTAATERSEGAGVTGLSEREAFARYAALVSERSERTGAAGFEPAV
jgi:hypothetical protein